MIPRQLIALAKETSTDKRREVMHALSHLFTEGADLHNDRELALFGDILCRLLDQVDGLDRLVLSKRVATFSQTPRDLVLKLAHDSSLVASPVLAQSPVLNENDLARIAMEHGQGHLAAIAARTVLSETVTDVLVDRGEASVLTTLARNFGARFSPDGFGTLGQKSKVIPGLGDALASRIDLPAKVARDLLAILTPLARTRIEHMLKFDTEHAKDLVDSALQTLDATRTDQKRNRAEVKLIVAEIRGNRRRVGEPLAMLIAQKRMVDIAALLADLADLQESFVSNALHKVNGTSIGLVCRWLKISDDDYEALSQLRCEKLRLPASHAKQMLREYNDLDQLTAERSLRFHKVVSAHAAGSRF